MGNNISNFDLYNLAAQAAQCANQNCEASKQNATQALSSAQSAYASANSAAESAAEAAASAEIAGIYLGPFAVAPTTDNEGNPLQEGMLYFNTVSNVLFVWNGTAWASSDFNEFTNFTATGTTTARNLVTREAEVYNVKDFGAIGDGVADDGPAIRAAAAAAYTNGGGVVYAPPGHYKFTNFQNLNYYGIITSGGSMVPTTIRVGLQLRAGVSLIGDGPNSVIFEFPTPALTGGICIGLVEYSYGKISGIKIQGSNPLSGTIHGIFFSLLLSDITWTNQDITIEDVEISNVSAYGIAQQYGNPQNVTLKNIKIENTGADGIDWKVRVGNGNPLDTTSGVIFDSIVVKNPGLRTDLTNLSGIGFRGRGIISNIEVTGIRVGVTGIELVAGTAGGDDIRQSTNRTVLSNFYCETTDVTGEVQGLKVFASGPVTISNGYLKRCIVQATGSGYGYIDGPSIANVIVDGARSQTSFRCETDRSSFFNCRSVADKQYFSSDRGNLIAGQTVFPIEYGITATLTALKNGSALVNGIDYNIVGSNVVLVVAAIITDEFIFIQSGLRPFRINALNCSIFGGGCDKYYTSTSYFITTPAQESTNIVGFYDERFPLFQMLPNGAVQFRSVSESADENLELVPKGNGVVRIFSPTTVTSDAPITEYIIIKDSAGTSKKLAIIA